MAKLGWIGEAAENTGSSAVNFVSDPVNAVTYGLAGAGGLGDTALATGVLRSATQRSKAFDGSQSPSSKETSNEVGSVEAAQAEASQADPNAYMIDPAAMVAEMMKAGKDAAAFNISQYPEVSSAVMNEALRSSGTIDATYQNRFDQLAPGLRTSAIGASTDALNQYKALADEYMTGKIPQDVQDELTRIGIELGSSRGLFGQARDYSTARNLGLTSLQLQQTGAGMLQNVPTLAGQATNLASSFMPGTNNLSSLYSQGMSMVYPAATINPSSLMSGVQSATLGNQQSGTQISLGNLQADTQVSVANMQNATEVALANQSLAWSQQLSQMQMDFAKQQLATQVAMQNQAISAQQQNSWTSGLLRLAGTAIGVSLASSTGGASMIFPSLTSALYNGYGGSSKGTSATGNYNPFSWY